MLYFRADMNEKIATGHIMRCLSIADAASHQGEESTFILADKQAEKLVKKRGHCSIVLHSEWNHLDYELEQMVSLIIKENIRVLLVDSYFVTEWYLGELRKHTNIIYLDDLNAFHYPVDTVLCYAPYYSKFQFEEKYPDTDLLLGTKFIPLREEFRDCGRKEIKLEIESILILSGGSDWYDVMDRLLEKLDKRKYKRIYAICGIYYGKFDAIVEKYKAWPSVEMIRATDDIKYYMEIADVAISAAGSTLYELAAVGTPTISYVVADNQAENAIWLENKGIIRYAGDVRMDDIIGNIPGIIEREYESMEERKSRSARMQHLVDGKGAERVAKKLIEKTEMKRTYE